MYIVKVLVEHAIYKLDTTYDYYLNIKFWQVVDPYPFWLSTTCRLCR